MTARCGNPEICGWTTFYWRTIETEYGVGEIWTPDRLISPVAPRNSRGSSRRRWSADGSVYQSGVSSRAPCLWSQSPCRTWPRPRSHPSVWPISLKGFRSLGEMRSERC